jgi:signal transduction histidine kinase
VGGLNRFRDGRFTVLTTQDGLPDMSVWSITEDRAGNVWYGTRNGLVRFRDGRFTTYTTQDGMGGNFIISFHEDQTGTLWIGSDGGGITRYKDGKFSAITVKDGLYDNLAFQILEDDDGNLWVSCNRGIYRVSLQELNDFADGKIATVNAFAYGVIDGMLSRECNGAQPGGWKTRDGRLWFGTIKGAVVIDPRRRNTEPPRVVIEGMMLDHGALPVDQPISIRPGQENLEIQYTALSWSRPQQIRFKYQLLGQDQTWVEAGTRRTAYFSHLSPGEYTFRVIADNGDGVWNQEGATIKIVVIPPFYQRWWFIALVITGTLSLMAFIYRYRVAQFERRRAAQQAFSRQLIASQEEERKRIAGELHDSLGQRLIVIKNLALLHLATSAENGQSQNYVSALSEETSQAINEVKEISYNLRPYQLDRIGLTKAIEGIIQKVSEASAMDVFSEIDDVDNLLSKESEINFYRIIQEAFNNIIKHAEAEKVILTVKRDGQHVRTVIKDNGKGFDAQTALHTKTRALGLGLIGITERAELLGAHPQIQSAPGQGTTITIDLNLSEKTNGR